MTFLGDTQQVKDLDRRGKGEEGRRGKGGGRREKGEGRREEEGRRREEGRREEREEEGGKREEAKRKKSMFTEYVSHTQNMYIHKGFPMFKWENYMHSLHSSKQDQPHPPP